MIDSRERNTDPQEKRKAAEKARREEQAAIVQGLQTVLQGDEQLLAFARGRIAGGWRGKLAVGPEAFFAPFVNMALTERRFLLQHIQPLSGKPSEILPHAFPLGEIVSLAFTEIETFGSEPAGRLVLRLNNEQHFRIRLHGQANVESAKTIAELFRSLAETPAEKADRPTQRKCHACGHVLDQAYKFCPYCSQAQPQETTETPSHAAPETSGPPVQNTSTPAEKETPTGEEAHQQKESESHGAAPLPEQSEAAPTEPGAVTPPVEPPADEENPDADRPQGGL